MKTLLLFDIDGTLLRAEGATHRAINKTYQELFGVKETIDVRSLIGSTDYLIFKDAARKLLKRELSGAEMKAVEKRYLELLPAELAAVNFHVKPGVGKLLPLLAANKDITLAVETGNLKPAAYLKLKKGGIDKYFKAGGFGNDSENRARIIRTAIERASVLSNTSFEPGCIFVIGDAPNDVNAGKEVGILTVAVGTGLLPREEVLAAKPDYWLDDLSDVKAFLKIIRCEEYGKIN